MRRRLVRAICGQAQAPEGNRRRSQTSGRGALCRAHKLAEMPRNSSPTRIRNRCEMTGRARGYYRKLRMCRNQLRELASQGLIPGMVKSSW